MVEQTNFQELISRVRAGDQAAASELVRQYEPAIRRAVRIRLVDPRLRRTLDSMDVCQSVFGSFFARTALGQYDLDSPQDLLNLLITMSRKKLADEGRRGRAARRDYRRTTPADLGVMDRPQEEATPSHQIAVKELYGEVNKRLSEEERRLAEQRAAGQDWKQIAADRGGSPEALRKQLARAVGRVTQELGLDE
jgi:RNA polymerase sigma-70 factor (ECF subfamily)